MKVGEKTALCGVNEVLDSVLKTPPSNELINYSLSPKHTKQQIITIISDISPPLVIIPSVALVSVNFKPIS